MEGGGHLGRRPLLHQTGVLGLVGRLGVHLELRDEMGTGQVEAAESAGPGGEFAGLAAHGQRPELGVLGLLAVLAHALGGKAGGAILGGDDRSDGGLSPGQGNGPPTVELHEGAAVRGALRVR